MQKPMIKPLFYKWDKEKQYPYYKEDEEEVEFPVQQFEDTKQAEIWLITNAPEYYFGASIVEVNANGSKKKHGDFSLIAVPSYYERTYGTNDRTLILNTILSEKATE